MNKNQITLLFVLLVFLEGCTDYTPRPRGYFRIELKKKEYYDEAQSHKEALAVQAAAHIKLVQELMDMLHESQREKAMDKIVSSRPDNIIAPQFRKPK